MISGKVTPLNMPGIPSFTRIFWQRACMPAEMPAGYSAATTAWRRSPVAKPIPPREKRIKSAATALETSAMLYSTFASPRFVGTISRLDHFTTKSISSHPNLTPVDIYINKKFHAVAMAAAAWK